MSEYLIQSETLDDIVDAINAKTGGTSAMTPAEMVTAIGTISGGEATFEQYLKNTIGDYSNDEVTDINGYACYRFGGGIRNLRLPNVTSIGNSAFYMASLSSIFAPNATLGASAFGYNGGYFTMAVIGRISGQSEVLRGNTNLAIVDFASINGSSLLNKVFNGCPNLKTVIIRSSTLCIMRYSENFTSTPFDSGGSGGTIYIPKVLYDHLGDGTSLDYKAATNWSTLDSYGTITWAQIEGSIYETQYADGTPIPSE